MSRVAILLALAVPAGLAAQDTGAVPIDTVVIEPGVPLSPAAGRADSARPMSTRGAFIRSMILPGWGQAAFGSNLRGGIFFAGWAGNWLMLFKTGVELEEARFRHDLRAGQLRDELIAGAPNPDSMRAVLDTTRLLETTIRADGLGNELRLLVRAREQQREDWIAWSVFWILASGIDGYVTAHLWDFPTGIEVRPTTDRGVSLRLETPLGRRRR